MAIKYEFIKKEYMVIVDIIDHILPSKYKKMDIKIRFINNRLMLLSRMNYFTIKEANQKRKGVHKGAHLARVTKSGVKTIGIDVYPYTRKSNSDAIHFADTIDTILHEIKHQWQSIHNVTMYMSNEEKMLDKCEDNAECFARTVVENNYDYIRGIIGYFYYT